MVAPPPFGRTVTFAERLSRSRMHPVDRETRLRNAAHQPDLSKRFRPDGEPQWSRRREPRRHDQKHWSPRLFTEITHSFLRPQIITTKGQYTLDANSFFSWQSTMQTLMVPPTFNVTYGQRLSSSSSLTGFTSVRSGTYPSVPGVRTCRGCDDAA